MAMDFSGKSGGRVIQNPMEAQSAEREEALSWRVREGWDCWTAALDISRSRAGVTGDITAAAPSSEELDYFDCVFFFICAAAEERSPEVQPAQPELQQQAVL